MALEALVPVGITALIFGVSLAAVSRISLEGSVIASWIWSLILRAGLLITFFQFLFTATISSVTQLNSSPSTNQTIAGHGLFRKPVVPLSKWAFVAFVFYSVNMLNNWAFAFSISVPVHIILRSFGSVTTMLVGAIRGKRFSLLQVASVGILTAGVLVSAWADSESKGKSMSAKSEASTTDYTLGLLILLAAQLLTAWQGVYMEDIYANHNVPWTENLFYSHFLSLIFFLPLSSTLRRQYAKLAATTPLDLSANNPFQDFDILPASWSLVPAVGVQKLIKSIPQGLLYLLVNAMTQLICISGVNLLSAKSSAVTVTIVLNIRKLVSFIFSTWIFAHELSGKMLFGAAMVFGSGALYGWETSWRIPQRRRAIRNGANAHTKKM